jgi:FixJ family two-component response regulator
VLDVRLREANGIEFQEWMAENGMAIPVVLITGYADIPMTVRGMRAGAVDILPKPFDDDTLIAVIISAIEADRKRRDGDADGIVLRALYETLTPRERETMSLVVAGLMNKQVAARMDLSEITVKIHRGNVMRKMGAQSLADLVRMAEMLGVRDETIHRFKVNGSPIIAVVDDDLGVRGSIDSLLRSAGMSSLMFASAEHLLASGLAAFVRCVVTDLHLPGMSGLELQLEMGIRGWSLPLVMMTAFPTSASRKAALDAGAVAFLVKPIEPETLLSLLRRHAF